MPTPLAALGIAALLSWRASVRGGDDDCCRSRTDLRDRQAGVAHAVAGERRPFGEVPRHGLADSAMKRDTHGSPQRCAGARTQSRATVVSPVVRTAHLADAWMTTVSVPSPTRTSWATSRPVPLGLLDDGVPDPFRDGVDEVTDA